MDKDIQPLSQEVLAIICDIEVNQALLYYDVFRRKKMFLEVQCSNSPS